MAHKALHEMRDKMLHFMLRLRRSIKCSMDRKWAQHECSKAGGVRSQAAMP
jgi:hypothetical protein